MRGIGWFASAVAFISAVALSRPAAADTMDPALGRLVLDERCRVSGPGGGQYYNPRSNFDRCTTDDTAFARLIAQYGQAIAPTAMHSARTTGYGGFELAIEAAYTGIDGNADYWRRGTQGAIDPSSNQFSVQNAGPSSVLQAYSIKIRKGFPFGLELTGNVGFLAQTNLVFGGADVRISVLEGFRRGIPAIFPEIAAGGSVRTVSGTEEFQLTVVGVDAQISKPIPLAGTIVLTPYVGYQWLRIFGDSGLIDLTPNTDAVDLCGYRGNNTPATPARDRNGNPLPPDGSPVCTGTSADFNNTVVFNPVRLTRHRIVGGLQFRFQMVKFGAQFSYDLVAPQDANTGPDYTVTNAQGEQENLFEGVGRQLTMSFDLGAVF
jgi:hypothetical protein